MATRITCYGGVGEIGGNKFLLEDGDTRLFLDFGIAFGRQQEFFNEFLRPRTSRGLLDLLALGLIPPLEGIYQERLAPPGMWDRMREAPFHRDLRRDGLHGLDGVLVSHAHLDHNGDLPYLMPQIPVYATRVSAFIARAMQMTGQTTFERELTYVTPRRWSDEKQALEAEPRVPYQGRAHAFIDGPLSEAARRWWETPPGSSRKLEPATGHRDDVASGEIGGLAVRWWPVDHSVPGASAWAVQTGAGWIAYTGDIRFHGRTDGLMESFVEALAALEPVALLCEGTHLQGRASITEEEVQENVLTLVRNAAGRLVVADFGPRNVPRLFTFLAVAKETGRKLTIQPKDALLLEAIFLADEAGLPDPKTLPELAVYADPKSAPRGWELTVRSRWEGRIVGAADVSANPGDYVLCFSLFDLNDLLDLENVAGGVYLYSNSAAYDEEQKVDLQRLRNWVRHAGLRLEGDPEDAQAARLHSSGHASGEDLLDMVRRVRPRLLLPVHTETPELWGPELDGTGITTGALQAGLPITIGSAY